MNEGKLREAISVFVGEITDIDSIGTGNICDTWLVSAGRGKYVARLRPIGFTRAHVEADQRLLLWLAERGFPVARVVSSPFSFVVSVEGRWLEVQEWVSHDSVYGEDDDQYRDKLPELAKLQGQFHALTQEYPEQITKPERLGATPIGFMAKYFEDPIKVGMARYRQVAPEDRKLMQLVAWFEKQLLSIREQILSALPSLPEVVNHNDFILENLLWEQDKVAALIDFDFACSGPHYIDLVEGVHGAAVFNGKELVHWGIDSDGSVRFEEGRAYLNAYFQEFSCPGFDSELFAKFLQAKVISLNFYPAFDFADTGVKMAENARRLRLLVENLSDKQLY